MARGAPGNVDEELLGWEGILNEIVPRYLEVKSVMATIAAWASSSSYLLWKRVISRQNFGKIAKCNESMEVQFRCTTLFLGALYLELRGALGFRCR
jgi:hypothetical protein